MLLAAAAWMVPAVESQASEPLYEILDPGGDVALTSLPGRPTSPANPYSDMLDIQSFRIVDETEEEMVLEISVADLPGRLETLHDFGIPSRLFTVAFDLGEPSFHYTLIVNDFFFGIVPGIQSNVPDRVPLQSWICLTPPPPAPAGGVGASCTERQPVPAVAVLSENRILVHLTKDALLGRIVPVRDQQVLLTIPKKFGRGDEVTNWRIMIADDLPPAGQDVAPQDGTSAAPYVFTRAAANTQVSLALSNSTGTDARMAGVEPGTANRIPIRVQNHADGKRFINLSVNLTAGSDDALFVQLPTTVEVPPRDERVVELVVVPSPGLAHRSLSQLLLRAQSVGLPEEIGSLRLSLQAAQSPNPAANRFHLHARATANFGVASAPVPIGLFTSQHWINVLDKDPNATGDGDAFLVGSSGSGFQGGIPPVFRWYDNFLLDTPLPTTLQIDPSEKVPVTLVMDARHPITATVTAQIFAGDNFFGSGQTTADLGPTARTTLEVPVQLLPTSTTIDPSMGRPRLYLETQAVDPVSLVGFGLLDRPAIYPGASGFTLPIVAAAAVPVNHTLQPLRLYGFDGTQDFVNPGKTRIVKVVILNQGDSVDVASLSANVDRAGWSARFTPGSKYSLGPGESVAFGVQIDAPQSAAEGETCKIDVRATSKNDPDASASLILTLVLTRGVELPDQNETYQVDDQALARAVNEAPPESPSPTLMGVLLGVAVVLVVRRHRAD